MADGATSAQALAAAQEAVTDGDGPVPAPFVTFGAPW
jgi:hypothetical protein